MMDFNLLQHSQWKSTQLNLDIYYYTLTWDKISKTYNKFKELINPIQKSESTSRAFSDDFKELKRRLDHLLGEFKDEVRNEYEHPSLEPKMIDNIIDWGSVFINSNGDIRAHVGKDQFSIVKKVHVDRLISIWIDLIDIFLKHFSDKPSSNDLIHLKNHIEEHIDNIICEYNNYIQNNKREEANGVIGQFLRTEIYLLKESIPLSQNTIEKFHSIIFGRAL
jgi:hypothetical protein